ncbi:energy transducer TonB [Roseivirga sp. BDSF3-8]|uniref:energy transducer TonB n=1 Tax=Roseivirga sp. BDSF3-8 TaxID=3241598 RepID=UPI003531DC4D
MLSKRPGYKGGLSALEAYLSEHSTHPRKGTLKEHKIVVDVAFSIQKDGSVDKVKNLSTVPAEYEDAAENIVKNMPAWNPGMKNGKPVSTKLEISIIFYPEKD